MILQAIANDMGCNVEIELFNQYATEPLETRVIGNYKEIFGNIVGINGLQITCLIK